MKVLVIIPAFNEEESILKTVADIKEHAPDYDYVIINDASKDNTLKLCEDNGLHVINLPVNLGIGGAVQTGYLYAYKNGYDLAVQFDGDGQHDARFLKDLEKTLVEENMDMVIGSRFLERQGYQSHGFRRAGIKFFRFLLRLFFGRRITDATSGMRMCNRKVMALFIKDYPRDYPEPETVARLLRHKYRVKEIPVEMKAREAGVSSISPWIAVYYMVKVTLAIFIERLR
ncbi:MAG: glycosyltransferase family 2 protein [Lachnospiraceae bacterium]|nr:glycosyltransferase family 2 protein [Lachnospiraceae bacterium]